MIARTEDISPAAYHGQLEVWAENCPDDFENRAALVGAEIARIDGCVPDADHNEAAASELAARFYMARVFDKIARTYLRDARHCYAR